MRVERATSIEEYARWYLRRDRRKHSIPIADEPRGPVEVMRRDHAGKMRDWFGCATGWHIVSFDCVRDLANLVALESEWTKREGLTIPGGGNYRLLGRVAHNAIANKYLELPSASRHKDYYDRLLSGSLRIEGEDRVVICSADECEIRANPDAQYYLLDGLGRCLPYMILLAEHKQEFARIEAFRITR
jgi:hypothetical protein